MRQRVVEVPFGLAPPEWIEDTQFDLDYHLRTVSIPEPGGVEDLLVEMSPLYATAFDRDRPLWEAYVAEGFLGGRGAVFMKMHHCMLDGVGGTRLFESLLGARRELAAVPPVHVIDARSESPAALLWRALLYNGEEFVDGAGDFAGSLWETARAPGQLVTSIRRALKIDERIRPGVDGGACPQSIAPAPQPVAAPVDLRDVLVRSGRRARAARGHEQRHRADHRLRGHAPLAHVAWRRRARITGPGTCEPAQL